MRRLAIIFLAVAAGLGLLTPPAQASVPPDTDPSADAADLAPVDVVQVSGLIDEILIDEIDTAIDEADSNGSQALILQINSDAAVVGRDRIADVMEMLRDSPVPIGIWVGPSGANLTGLGAQLLAAADVTGMAPGAHIGKYGTPLQVEGVDVSFGVATERMQTKAIGFQDARSSRALKLETTDEGVPAIKNMVLAMDGLTLRGKVLDTVTSDFNDDGQAQNNATLVRFFKLGLVNQLLHTVSSPAVAYLLFIIGLALLIFEFFTAGVGVAGVVGAACAILACYGLSALPVNGFAVAAIIASMFAFAIDVQVGIPRLWTGVGFVLFTGWVVVPVPRGAGHRSSAVVDHARRGYRRGHAHVRRRHALDGAHSLRHADRGARVDDRRDGYCAGRDQSRGRGRSRRWSLASPHQPGHAAAPR